MTDNSRPTASEKSADSPDDGGNRHSAGENQGQRRRRRRRRGRRSASNQNGQQNQQNQPGKQNGDKGGDKDSAQKQQNQPNQQGGDGKSAAKRSRRRRRRRSQGAGQNNQGNQKNQNSQSKSSSDDKSGQSARRRGGKGRKHTQAPARRPSYQSHSRMETRDETSAGGLVVSGMAEAVGADGSVDLSRIYVALIGRLDRRGRLLWSMPKGHVESGEHQWQTAEREVWEETGIHGEAFFTLGVIDYWFVSDGVRIHKTVHHNLLRYVDGELNDEDPEVTEVTWVPVNELIEHLAYADERKLARQAFDHMPELARKEHAAGRATPR